MTIAEFNAWLDGFKEAIGDAPTPEQWQRVLEKLASVSLMPSPTYITPPQTLTITSPYTQPYRFGQTTCTNAAVFKNEGEMQ